MEKIKEYIYRQLQEKQLSVTEAREYLKELAAKDERKPAEAVNSTRSKDIAIIGMAGRFADTEDLESFWQALQNGRDFVRPLPQARRQNVQEYLRFIGWTEDDVLIREGAYLEDIDQFEPDFFNISPAEASLMDPNQRVFLEVAVQAIEDAGYSLQGLSSTNTGLFLGFSQDFGDRYKHLVKLYDPEKLTMATLGNINSVITGRIAHMLDWRGPAMLVDTACSSSLVAVHQACMSIRNGECEQALAGGVKLWPIPAEPRVGGEFGGDIAPGIGIEAKDGRCHTFDAEATGAGFGEGAGAILLKSLSKALADGDSIYAVIKGTALNQDGRSIGISAPNITAQKEVIQKALKDGSVEASTIQYIEAHGTGTKLGDPIEVHAIIDALGKETTQKSFCGIGSVKSNIGHLDHAAGIVGLIKLALALKKREIPPTIHFTNPNPNIDFSNSAVYVVDRLTQWPEGSAPRRGGISSFGLSGTNCHMILEEAPQLNGNYVSVTRDSQQEVNANRTPWHLFTLSARKEESLEKLVGKYIDYLKRNPTLSIENLCYTVNTGRSHHNCRLVLIAKDTGDLLSQLKSIASQGLKQKIAGRYAKIEAKPEQVNHNPLINPTDWRPVSSDQYRESLQKIADFYLEGQNPHFENLYQKNKLQRLNLPVYIFTRKKCWVSVMGISRQMVAVTRSIDAPEVKEWQLKIKEEDGEKLNERQRKVATIWAKVMEIDEISIYDNFYDLGGDSIIGMMILNEIKKEFAVELPMEKIFTNPTVSAVSELISEYQGLGTKFTKIQRRPVVR